MFRNHNTSQDSADNEWANRADAGDRLLPLGRAARHPRSCRKVVHLAPREGEALAEPLLQEDVTSPIPLRPPLPLMGFRFWYQRDLGERVRVRGNPRFGPLTPALTPALSPTTESRLMEESKVGEREEEGLSGSAITAQRELRPPGGGHASAGFGLLPSACPFSKL